MGTDQFLEIPADHTGPVASGQGGIAAGLMARFVDGAAEVRLHAPPPLATPLQVHRGEEGRVHATLGDTTIMSARPAEVEVAVPSLDLAAARQPAHAPDGHLAPACIVCGDGHPRSLQVQPRPVPGARLSACEWVPPDWVADEEGNVSSPIVWGVLDCPGGWAIAELGQLPDEAFPALGTMAASIREPVPVGQPTVVAAWPLDSPGHRRHKAAVAILGVDGTIRAVARQTCIAMPANFALGRRGDGA